MSSDAERRPPLPAEWDRLELAVRRALDDYERTRRRAEAAEARTRELESTVRELAGGTIDPLRLTARVDALEAETGELRARLAEAAERVRRLLARLQFLEEAR